MNTPLPLRPRTPVRLARHVAGRDDTTGTIIEWLPDCRAVVQFPHAVPGAPLGIGIVPLADLEPIR